MTKASMALADLAEKGAGAESMGQMIQHAA
jgi:hypothetical protein